jgi:hypothetical protein
MTAGDGIAAEQVPGQDNIRESVVTFSDANQVDVASPFGGSSSISTTRTIVVDATKHLEAGSTTSSKLIPGVNDVTKGMQDVVRSAKHCVRIFRIDNEIFEVNEEQLDRVRMSKCSLEGRASRLQVYSSEAPRGDIVSITNAKCSFFFPF